MNKKYLLSALIVPAFITGCQTTNLTKEDYGQYGGALLGAIGGAAIADDNRWLGAAIGSTVGYFAGQMIGKYLDEQDQKELAAETVYTLDKKNSGSTTWKSDRNNSRATIKTGDISYSTQSKKIKHLKTVQTVPDIRLEKREYKTTASLKLRSGPGTQYSTLKVLKPGDIVLSSGRTKNNWLMLSKQGVTVGYISAAYVTPYSPLKQAKAQGIALDSLEIPEQTAFEGIDLDAVETTSSTVSVQKGCRDIQISVTTDKGSETENTQACQNDNGVWELG